MPRATNSVASRRKRKKVLKSAQGTRIGIAARNEGLSYNKFIRGLKVAGIEINRKILAELAVHNQAAFANLVKVSKESIH